MYLDDTPEERDGERALSRTQLPVAEHQRTAFIVNQSSEPNGGYTELPVQNPDLYSTYHFLAIQEHEGIDTDAAHATATEEWARELVAERFAESGPHPTSSNESVVSLSDYYYAAGILAQLSDDSAHERQVRENVSEFRLADGSYCAERLRDGACVTNSSRVLATYRAVTTLDTVDGLADDERKRTTEWVRSQWERHEIRNESSLGTEYRLLATLEALDADITEQRLYDERRSNVTEYFSGQSRPLYDNIAELENHYYLRQYYHLEDAAFNRRAIAYLNESRRADGGYNVLGYNYSDSKGTEIATRVRNAIADELEVPQRQQADIRTLLAKYRLSGGGYAPVYRQRVSAKTTHYALEIGQRFGYDERASRDRAQIDSLDESDFTRATDVESLYRHATLLEDSRSELSGAVNSTLITVFDEENRSLRDCYYAIRLSNLYEYSLNEDTIMSYVRSRQNDDGGFGSPSNTEETYYAVMIASELDATASLDPTVVDWLRNGRNESGGYHARVGGDAASVPDLYSTHASVRALSALGEKPVDPTTQRQWVDSLESPNGGFYQTKHETTTPTMQSTYWGIDLLSLLAPAAGE
ncbi:prenyltransferase/squalene oxidase repeat-containing protein [Natrinema salaciae]|nr:prenyltransferase/squalene oxidase repeat-containing protein [Natrinema salaciae]